MNDDKLTIRLLRERADKLEATLNAYDLMLNTSHADALRHRNDELERTLWDVVHSGLLPPAELNKLTITLRNKVKRKY